MEAARNKLNTEGTEKKTAEGRDEELRVGDYIDIVREISGLVRENYITDFQLILSIRK